jgi:diguanylate cyclase (GGDEF)-like protein
MLSTGHDSGWKSRKNTNQVSSGTAASGASVRSLASNGGWRAWSGGVDFFIGLFVFHGELGLLNARGTPIMLAGKAATRVGEFAGASARERVAMEHERVAMEHEHMAMEHEDMASIPENTMFDDDLKERVDDATRRLSIQRPVLIQLDGSDMHRRHSIDKPQVLIGRDMMADIVISDSKSSRRHARLTFVNFGDATQEPEVYVEDLGSTNGSFLNGARLTERQRLKDRDKLLVGATLFNFSVRDQNELQMDQQLLALATSDALTGLHNRGMFNREIQKEFDRARRYKREISLVMFDIDHFKKVNDDYGHQVGDFVLKEIGMLVRQNQRTNDLCSRYGGEEFVLILPETGLDGALVNAERLRASVANHGFFNEQVQCQVTISLGIATQEPTMNACEDLIETSDRALYHSKANGRNCVSYSRDGALFLFQST